MKGYFVISTIIFASFGAKAYFELGSELVEDMREWEKANHQEPNTNYSKATGYSSYVSAIYDSLDLNNEICTRKKPTKGQVNAIVSKYLFENPSRWDEPAYFLVADALKAEYSCKK